MRTIQKLEFISGFTTLVATILYIIYIYMPFMKKMAESNNDSDIYHWSGAFFILIFPSLLIGVSSYFHAFKQSYIAFTIIIIVGSVVTILHFLSYLLGSAFEGHVLIGVLRGFFAFTTIILAFFNLILTLSNSKELSTR
jgi:hypothetical protein